MKFQLSKYVSKSPLKISVIAGWFNWISEFDASQFGVSFFSMLGLRMSFTSSVDFLIGFSNVFFPRTFNREKRLRDEREEWLHCVALCGRLGQPF